VVRNHLRIFALNIKLFKNLKESPFKNLCIKWIETLKDGEKYTTVKHTALLIKVDAIGPLSYNSNPAGWSL
jgi:hypothetical protein